MWLALAACVPSPPPSAQLTAWELFPFDGERTWTYVSTDETLPHALVATSSGVPEVEDGANVYTVVTAKACRGADPSCVDGEEVHRIRWSSDQAAGVQVHGYTVAGEAPVVLSPPVRFADDPTLVDQPATTETGGASWSSTWVGGEPCPLAMAAEWDCHALEVEVDGGDGYPLAGTWWATRGNGVAAMEILGESGRWQLEDVACDGECDGRW